MSKKICQNIPKERIFIYLDIYITTNLSVFLCLPGVRFQNLVFFQEDFRVRMANQKTL
jgi:hypothetical protein